MKHWPLWHVKLCTILNKAAARFAILLIDIYRLGFSAFLGHRCRFTPSCSQYARQAYLNHGFLRASFLVAKRLLKCHPFGPYGLDPVPERKTA